ncbi:LysR family transcriptional regulator [Seohaeicola saemankumensis]|nr:LysR family transcriptional regulator [Seohaeicola saemankumensis]MCA0871516.1 LysR family transcriptional regulator [Seohaeicola saemankumensis]
MRFKRLDLNLLVALDHMLELQSVSAAADRMHMSQSAMSNALTRLRDYFDDPLLVQVGRRMERTPRAEAMREAVRDILVRVEATIETEPQFRPESSDREFNVLMSDYTMTVLMPHVLALARAAGSRARFNLLAQTDRPYVLVERGEADFLVSPRQFCSPEHPSDVLYQDNYCCVVWNEGAYAGRPLSVEDYQRAGHAVMVPPNQAHSVESESLARMGINRRVELTTFSFSALPQLAVGTDLVATVHGLIARQAAKVLPLEISPLPFGMEPLEQTLQWHAYRDHDPGIQWVRQLFLEAAKAVTH